MNYKTLVKGALALSLSLIVGSASAATTTPNDAQKYGATFENAVSTVAPLNDYAYQLDSGITNQNYRDEVAAKGWFAGSDDESKIIARTDAAGGQALQLNTDAGTLTNKFASGVATDLNNGIAAAGAYFETEVKFVPSDTQDAGITGGTDATKFAIYAYANEDAQPPVTNLVVYHAYANENAVGGIDYTNEVFSSVSIDATVYTKLRVEMKKLEVGAGLIANVFSVSVNDGAPLASDTAIDAALSGNPTGTWFMTVEEMETAANKQVSSLNFKGTGEIDNIKAGVIEETTTYDVTWTADKVAVSNTTDNAAIVEGVQGSYSASTQFTFYPTEGTITNINGVAQDPGLPSYVVNVSSDTNIVIYAGEPAQSADEFKAGDDVDGEITADQAAWLNSYIGTYTYAELADLTAWQDKYLLNVDPFNGAGTLTVTSITVGNSVVVQIALARTEDGTAISGNRAIKGVLKLYGTDDLSTQFAECGSTTIEDADFSEGNTTTATFTGSGKNFFKAVIVAPAAPAQD